MTRDWTGLGSEILHKEEGKEELDQLVEVVHMSKKEWDAMCDAPIFGGRGKGWKADEDKKKENPGEKGEPKRNTEREEKYEPIEDNDPRCAVVLAMLFWSSNSSSFSFFTIGHCFCFFASDPPSIVCLTFCQKYGHPKCVLGQCAMLALV